MYTSIFDIFNIGVGPSSSHTIGPIRAANQFLYDLTSQIENVYQVNIELFGSLAYTGKGHGTDKAILMGLEGNLSETIEPDYLQKRSAAIIKNKKLKLAGKYCVSFAIEKDLLFNFEKLLPFHTNGMRFTAFDSSRKIIIEKIYYSVGGGFIADETGTVLIPERKKPPFVFTTSEELLNICKKKELKIHEVILQNEKTWATEEEIKNRLLFIDKIMQQAIKKGCKTEGILPGGLNVKRRAPLLYQKLKNKKPRNYKNISSLSWVSMFALAVAEENASGGKIVTAPTSGSAGIIPAVLNYFKSFFPKVTDEKIMEFLIVAGGIGILYKTKASISGAEVGCQGEVGVACSMAAAALTSVLGGSIAQIEDAAEIAMEHHLGLTCDPVKGLVQIPCIERNAIAAVQAVNVCYLALLESGEHLVSLDNIIKTMMQTGQDMSSKYKETSQGGLAVNVINC